MLSDEWRGRSVEEGHGVCEGAEEGGRRKEEGWGGKVKVKEGVDEPGGGR
jgi:hypothetical protein